MYKIEDAMNDNFRIQLRIAGKQYPLKCKRDEEKFFRSAASLINDKLLQYGNKYQRAPVDDKDLVVMAACDIVAFQKWLLDQQDETPADEKIKELNAELEKFIEEESKS